MYDDVFNTAKTLLKIADNENDAILQIIAEDCVNAILSYCKIDSLPPDLVGFAAVNTAKNYGALNQTSAFAEVSSVSEGDRSVSFRDSISFTNDFETRLKPYINRRGYVPSMRRE